MLAICFSSIYLIWRVFGTIPWTDGAFQAAAGILLVLAEIITTLGMFELMISRMKAKKVIRDLPDVPEEQYPDVDVLIATHNEPAELLYKTVNACTFLEYPDKGRCISISATTAGGGKRKSWRSGWEWAIWDFRITGTQSRETITMRFPVHPRL